MHTRSWLRCPQKFRCRSFYGTGKIPAWSQGRWGCDMSVPGRVVDLVERFEADRKTYRSTAYKEEWIRQDFIDPLFETLGWDVTNKSGVPVGPHRRGDCHSRGSHRVLASNFRELCTGEVHADNR